MERKKQGIVFMVVMSIGMILSVVGMMIASGLDQGGFSYSAFQSSLVAFGLFFILGITVLYPDIFEKDDDETSLEIV